MRHLLLKSLFPAFLLLILLACSDQKLAESDSNTVETVSEVPEPGLPSEPEPTVSASAIEESSDDIEAILAALESGKDLSDVLEPTAAGGGDGFEFYTIKVGADTKLQIPGGKGELRVWIGDEGFSPEFEPSMSEATGLLPAVGRTAKVEAYAPDFEVEPASSQCIIIHPTGSEVRFQLTPKKAGVYKVGANVNLYHSDDCSGAAIPKTAESLQVNVDVNSDALREDKKKEFFDIFWQKLLEFWEALLVMFFGLILFLVRGKLKKLFGFEQEK